MNQTALELATDIARVRGLYKLPPLPSPARVLEVVSNQQTPVIFSDKTFSGTHLYSATVEKLAYNQVDYTEFQEIGIEKLEGGNGDEGTYDLIIIHGTLKNLKASLAKQGQRTDNRELFSALAHLLKHSGIIAGCIQNRLSLRRILSPGSTPEMSPDASFPALVKSLRSADFDSPRIFSLYPGRLSPITLAEVNNRPSISHSTGQVQYLKNWLGTSNHRIKSLLSLLGISLWLEDEYFFYARKP